MRAVNNIRKSEKWSDFVSAALWFIVVIALLVMTVMGARCYKLAVDEKGKNDHVRETLSYIQSRADGSKSVALKKGPEGDMLCFPEADGDFETRIYVYGGMLTEELSQTDAAPAPEMGQAICSVQSFDAEAVDGGVILVTVDGKFAYVGKGETTGE